MINQISACPAGCECTLDGLCWRESVAGRPNSQKGSKMRIKALVVGCRTDSWEGKKGKINQDLLTIMDLDKEHRLDQMVDFVLPNDGSKVPVMDAVVELAVTHIEPAFGGRLRLRGVLMTPSK